MTNLDVKMGTVGGLCFCLCGRVLPLYDFVQTILLAALGAVSSFVISMLLKRMMMKKKAD